MSAALKRPAAREEFLAWEEQQDLRHEFDGVDVVAMTGGTWAHGVIQANLAVAVGRRLRGTACRFVGNDVKISTRHGYRYPDGFVACTSAPNISTVFNEPIVLFEVWSPSTVSGDLITKNLEYLAIPSVRRYVQLAADLVGAVVFERAGEDWVGHVVAGDAVLRLPEIGIELPLSELYEGLSFTPG